MRLKSVKKYPTARVSCPFSRRKKKWTLNCTNEVSNAMVRMTYIQDMYVEISVGKCYFIGKKVEWILIFSRNCEFANYRREKKMFD